MLALGLNVVLLAPWGSNPPCEFSIFTSVWYSLPLYVNTIIELALQESHNFFLLRCDIFGLCQIYLRIVGAMIYKIVHVLITESISRRQ